jgi:hypothetical protein
VWALVGTGRCTVSGRNGGGKRRSAEMLFEGRLDDARIVRIEAALRPHAWRRMRTRVVARRLVEEIDGDLVATDDDRVWMVEQALSACRWQGLTIAGVARQAAAALEAWDANRRWLDIELAWLLDSG